MFDFFCLTDLSYTYFLFGWANSRARGQEGWGGAAGFGGGLGAGRWWGWPACTPAGTTPSPAAQTNIYVASGSTYISSITETLKSRICAT